MSPGPRPGRDMVRAGLWLVAAALIIAPGSSPMAEDKELPESNLALLDRSLYQVAEELLNRAAIPSGTRLAIATGGERPVDKDMEHAFLTALTRRGFEAWALDAGTQAAKPTPVVADTSVAELSPDLQAAQEARMSALGVDPAETGSTAGGETGEDASQRQKDWLSGVADHLPVMVFEVEEARVDYPRMYRSGVFGGQHVERRAMARVSARMLRAETRAVYWVGVADTSLSDIVPRSDLKFLEDKTRAETRGTVPTSDWTKIAEPALVVALVVGLVALFYSNRP
jgi:hypothetical protein